ncbi:Rho GTPase activation protein [Cylindrobasidium torrendii FP15055 ss-10]|uniref:Rho GTPase activation protein n=1 Tax=Cylindrobasidium torrendii FP15055 ss-10 TaxID=1314674 RepID=A0A0D7AVP6_9AGAR|nr:Rho GTPase activation protein [Cylindrobasidium torrendii FP15055 ss-10]
MIADPAHQPPSKASLKAWWNHFTFVQKVKRDAADAAKEPHPVFGKTLIESLKYASVQISTANAKGDLYVWGYIPVVVAKCGLYLKENATEVAGVFRVNGSAKRMRDLQALFETPPRYGKSLDWKTVQYTPHDVASVFRRYLTQMPEPVIPFDMYHDFRDALAKQPHNQDEIITTYKRLIRNLPRPNQYLLLYVLDLLSVFARKADINLMTATNLAVIFRPGILSHPSHEMSPTEHSLSQRVLEFLIAHQDWFMLDIPPPPPNEVGSNASPLVGSEPVVPSSDDEKADSRRVTRRRTTIDRYTQGALTELGPTTILSSVTEGGENAGSGVSRSRTLPSNRKGPNATGPGMLRKGRRPMTNDHLVEESP